MSMSNDKKKSTRSHQRRSALSFALNGSLDIDHILELSPWKDIEKFEKDEAGCIQNVLNEFNNRLSHEKLYPAETMSKQTNNKQAKKNKSKEILVIAQGSKDDVTNNVFGSSSSDHYNDGWSETDVKETLHTNTLDEHPEKLRKETKNKNSASKQLTKEPKDKATQCISQKQKTSKKAIKDNQDTSDTGQTDKMKKKQKNDSECDTKTIDKKKSCKKKRNISFERKKRFMRKIQNSKKFAKELEKLTHQMAKLTEKMLCIKTVLDDATSSSSYSDSSDKSYSSDDTSSSTSESSYSKKTSTSATTSSDSESQISSIATEKSTESDVGERDDLNKNASKSKPIKVSNKSSKRKKK